MIIRSCHRTMTKVRFSHVPSPAAPIPWRSLSSHRPQQRPSQDLLECDRSRAGLESGLEILGAPRAIGCKRRVSVHSSKRKLIIQDPTLFPYLRPFFLV